MMPTKKRRFMLTVTEDIEADAATAKQEYFFDKPYSEMYRRLIRLGLDALKCEQLARQSARIVTANKG